MRTTDAAHDESDHQGQPTRSTSEEDRFLTIQEVADLMSVKTQWLYDICQNPTATTPRPPAFRFGRQLRFKRSEVLEWIAGQRA